MPTAGQFYFIEVNPRIQVEHTVTEMRDRASIWSRRRSASPTASASASRTAACRRRPRSISVSHALQCRVTTEDPHNNFVPDYGRITAYRSPAGFGVRLDAGTAYSGAMITRSYDSLLVKVTTWAATPEETIARMHRALWEFRVRGVATNLRFLDQIITHPCFKLGSTPRASSMRRRSCLRRRHAATAPRAS